MGRKSSDDSLCSSQPVTTDVCQEVSVRRVKSDPLCNSHELNTATSNGAILSKSNSFSCAKTRQKSGLTESSDGHGAESGKENVTPTGTSIETRNVNLIDSLKCGDMAVTTETTRASLNEHNNACTPLHSQIRQQLPCQRLHALQEHLLREITRPQREEQADELDADTSVMLLMETMLKAIGTLSQRCYYRSNGGADLRLEKRPLSAVSEDDTAAFTNKQVSKEKSVDQDDRPGTRLAELIGDRAGSILVTGKSLLHIDAANLSDVWVPENLRWKCAFRELAHAPLCTLVASNGVFYSEDRKYTILTNK